MIKHWIIGQESQDIFKTKPSLATDGRQRKRGAISAAVAAKSLPKWALSPAGTRLMHKLSDFVRPGRTSETIIFWPLPDPPGEDVQSAPRNFGFLPVTQFANRAQLSVNGQSSPSPPAGRWASCGLVSPSVVHSATILRDRAVHAAGLATIQRC